MLDAIMAVALEHRPRYRPLSRQARELQDARVCYDHLAGRLSVDLAEFFTSRGLIVFEDEAAQITLEGLKFLAEFGIDLSEGTKRRHLCRACLDWTERRPHIGGVAGAALAKRCFDLGWIERMKNSRAINITDLGKQGFSEIFEIAPFEEQGATLRSA
jgi:hypothetical protein